MLMQRLVTGICLIILVLLGLFLLPFFAFATFVTLILGAAAWEWMTLIGIENTLLRVLLLALMLLISVASYWFAPLTLLSLSCLYWLSTILIVVQYPTTKKLKEQPWLLKLLMGLLTFPPCWVGINMIRENNHLSTGAIHLLYILAMVWVLDSFAYFVGRKLGKRKLMPEVSPGKSVEGVIGGLLGVVLFVILIPLPVTMYGSRSLFVLFAIALGIMSVFGDLFESVLKREAGVKDSGKLLPGHGGLLDRLDSTLAIIPFVALFLPLIRF